LCDAVGEFSPAGLIMVQIMSLDELEHDNPRKSTSCSFECLKDLLSYYGRKAPDRCALIAPGRLPLTYGALWTQTTDVVRVLRSIGVGRTNRVAVALPDGPEAALAMIAVAAGAVCAPLNPDLTEDEYQRYFAELRPAALLTRAELRSASRCVAERLSIPVLDISTRSFRTAGAFIIVGQQPPPRASEGEFASSADDAFMLLTSGSTSRPKTVPLTHLSVCLSARNVCTALKLRSRDRLLSVLPLFHGHGLISGLLAALTVGSSVVCTSGFDVTAFFACLTEFRPTWYTAVPAIHRALLLAAGPHKQAARRSSLRLVRSASSTLPHDVLRGLEALFGVPVIDTYGMTEAATQIAANPLQRRKLGSVGRPAGPEIAILDTRGRRLQPGHRGEIALRGPTITRGYDNDAAATASAFRNGWFRTGDLGYVDGDGYLFIIGRIKEIIHKGGQKVAPAEIEQALLSHPDVIDAAAFPVPHRRLVEDVAAAVVLRQNANVSERSLRDFTRERLAAFKVPGHIQIVSGIPKTAGGKLNRGELSIAFSKTQSTAARLDSKTIASRSELERELAGMWADLLDVDEVGMDQDVFALGVDSLAATEMILRVEERFGLKLSFEDIFDAPTVAAFAFRLKSSKKRSNNLLQSSSNQPLLTASVEGEGLRPVSIVQERMLRIERKLPGLPQFNLPFAYRLQGPLNIPALERSLAGIMRRHALLRTVFTWRDDEPRALVMPDFEVKPVLVVKDVSARARPRNIRMKELLLLKAKLQAERESLIPIDVNHAPLFRAYLFRLDVNDHVLLLVVHDVIIDGWSMIIFMEELSEIYSASIIGRKPRLPEPQFEFFDFARWQRRWSTTAAADRQFAYWRRRLDGVSPLFTAPKSNVGGELSSRVVQQQFEVPNDLVAQLRALSHSQGVTPFMSLLAAFKTLLLLHSGRTDICVATLIANRAQMGRQRVIGPFANTALIRTQIDPDLTFSETLKRVRKAVLEAYACQELPFDIVATRIAQEAGLSPAALVRVYFVLQIAFRGLCDLQDVTITPFDYQEARTVMPIDRAWLSMALNETSFGIRGICGHKTDLFEPNTPQQWIADYTGILAKAVANPNKELGRLVGR
jgi:acyl-CoA synthetase (AMP-forming)/AMP-acid ligase II/acyl carrier protein